MRDRAAASERLHDVDHQVLSLASLQCVTTEAIEAVAPWCSKERAYSGAKHSLPRKLTDPIERPGQR